jgi:hypothetical protein
VTRMLAIAGALAACAPRPSHPLPSASLTPRAVRHTAAQAPQPCGDDIAYNGDSSPDLTLDYSYDGFGRVAGAIGTYTAGGSNDVIVYAYNNLDQLTSYQESNAYGGMTISQTQSYDALGDMVSYVYAYNSASTGSNVQAYTNSQFTSFAQPAVEVVQATGVPDTSYAVEYDDLQRITQTVATPGSSTTIYTYDDDNRTLSVDTDDGSFTGFYVFDGYGNELSELWGGSNQYAYPTQTVYRYNGDQLLGYTYSTGTPLTATEVDTMRYCASTR